MKRIVLPFITLLFFACDQVDPADRYIAIDNATPGGQEPTEAVETRRVLIEEFTGQRCVNCPNAAAEIQRLKQAYGADTVIAVSIHGGELAFYSTAKLLGLRTELGDEYNKRWNVAAWPKGMVNRSGLLSDYEEWFTLVNSAVKQEAPLKLSVEATTSAITTTAEALKPVQGKLQLWVTESGITAMQAMPDGTNNREYTHNHVLRTAVNGAWGEDITLAQGQTETFTHTIALDPAWNSGSLSVVAFVYNDSEGLLQVVETAVK